MSPPSWVSWPTTVGATREAPDPAPYLAFDAMACEGANHLILGERDRRIVACYRITFILGLSLVAPRRAQIEGVLLAHHLRGQGAGAALIADAEARARAAGCGLMQLTTNAARTRAAFLRSHGLCPQPYRRRQAATASSVPKYSTPLDAPRASR